MSEPKGSRTVIDSFTLSIHVTMSIVMENQSWTYCHNIGTIHQNTFLLAMPVVVHIHPYKQKPHPPRVLAGVVVRRTEGYHGGGAPLRGSIFY